VRNANTIRPTRPRAGLRGRQARRRRRAQVMFDGQRERFAVKSGQGYGASLHQRRVIAQTSAAQLARSAGREYRFHEASHLHREIADSGAGRPGRCALLRATPTHGGQVPRRLLVRSEPRIAAGKVGEVGVVGFMVGCGLPAREGDPSWAAIAAPPASACPLLDSTSRQSASPNALRSISFAQPVCVFAGVDT